MTAEAILKELRLSDETDDSVSSRLDDILEAMKEIASLSFDAGKEWAYGEINSSFNQCQNTDPTKEQFINNLFNE